MKMELTLKVHCPHCDKTVDLNSAYDVGPSQNVACSFTRKDVLDELRLHNWFVCWISQKAYCSEECCEKHTLVAALAKPKLPSPPVYKRITQ